MAELAELVKDRAARDNIANSASNANYAQIRSGYRFKE